MQNPHLLPRIRGDGGTKPGGSKDQRLCRDLSGSWLLLCDRKHARARGEDGGGVPACTYGGSRGGNWPHRASTELVLGDPPGRAAAAAPSPPVRVGTHGGGRLAALPQLGSRRLDLTANRGTPKPSGSPRSRRHKNHARGGGASGDRGEHNREVAGRPVLRSFSARQRLSSKARCEDSARNTFRVSQGRDRHCRQHSDEDRKVTEGRRAAGRGGGTPPAECPQLAAPARRP